MRADAMDQAGCRTDLPPSHKNSTTDHFLGVVDYENGLGNYFSHVREEINADEHWVHTTLSFMLRRDERSKLVGNSIILHI